MTRRASLLNWTAVVLASALLAGCGALFGSRYDNFRAYYNTFYNAERAFEEAEEQIIRDDLRVDRTRYLQVLPKPDQRRNSGASGPFEEVIDKCARLLRENPDTKYTDDALLLIGKSYYYQTNYEGAKLNLREAIRVAQEEGRQREEDEARLWLGRSLAANGQGDQAATTLRESIDREGAREQSTSLMRLALAQLHVQDERWEEAASALVEGIPRVDDGDLAARAQFLLGQVYEALELYDEAAEAYAAVLDYKPLYELRYAANINRVLALGLGAGQTEAALSLVRRMLRDDNNFSNRAELEVAEARVLNAAGRPDDARDVLLALLYDDEGQNVGQMRGEALYRLGEVYREGFEDFSRAAVYLDSAATSLRAPAQRRSELTRQAFLDVDEEAEVYVSFADAARLVAEYDSLLELGSLDEEAFRSRIAVIQQQQQLAAALERERQDRLRSRQGFQGGARAGGFASPDDPGLDAASVGQGGSNFGFLSFRNPARVQEAYVAFEARWGDRPLAPNWRRREALSVAVADGNVGVDDLAEDFEPTAVGLGVDVTAVPRTVEAQTLMRADRAAALYEMGTALFLGVGRPDSAAVVYREVIRDADEVVAERAYYALAEVERVLGNDDAATEWYRHVIETYPDSELADQARERLGLARRAPADQDEEQDQAETAYALAYATWQEGDYPSAFENMLTVNEVYPESDVAARALLAAGRVYAEWATTGSVGLYEPLPEADTLDLSGLYDQIVQRYADTPYARRATTLRDALEEARPQPDTLALDPDLLLPADSLALPDLDETDGFAPAIGDSVAASDASAVSDSVEAPSDAQGAEGVDSTATPDSTTMTGGTGPAGDVAAPDSMEIAPSLAPSGIDSLSADQEGDAASGEDAAVLPGLTPHSPALGSASGGGEAVLRRDARILSGTRATTWVVGTFGQRADAEPLLRRLALDGYQTALLREQRGQLIRFLVVVGQFESAAAADAVRDAAAALVSEGVEPYQFDLENATIVLQGADLRDASGEGADG